MKRDSLYDARLEVATLEILMEKKFSGTITFGRAMELAEKHSVSVRDLVARYKVFYKKQIVLIKSKRLRKKTYYMA